ncbi:MAG TPA: NAD-dependent epimerase/dehydratase family protein [Pseudonocardia sp.]|nr:NAD-dependent epimerase/dehydratase family protein [Pseudonocardia sp.]
MRILVLGGTVFLSHAVAVEALARGHRVSCLARGVSGSVPAGARLLVADRNEPGALGAAVGGESFDAVVDVATMSLPWVSEALAALAGSVAHWTFISSVNVYADKATPGQGVDAPLLSPYVSSAGAATPDVDPDLYGAAKVASENAVLSAFGERAFVVRAGLLVGPGDPHDRFGYWPARFSRGGRTIVPDALDQPFQYLDVRDLAAWVVSAAERGLGGVFDGAGPRRTLGEVLRGIASAVGASSPEALGPGSGPGALEPGGSGPGAPGPDTLEPGGSGPGGSAVADPKGGAPALELVAASPSALLDAGVTPWAGPRSLPLWLPPTHYGFLSRDTSPALAAGLSARPLAESASDALAYERSLGLDRPRLAGLSAADEADLLTRLT